jgi:glutamate dehydrogenase/leucine dehydrogenase
VEVVKLESTDGFIAFDLGDAPSVGIVRQAPKVLRDGAELLARSTTYAAASFGLSIGGGSAGLNAKPDDRDTALAAFLSEVAPLVESGRWLPGPGVGIQADDLSTLPRAEERATAFDQTAAGESAVAAALGALGSLDGKRVAIVGGGPNTEAAAASVSANGGTPQPQAGFDAECDALLVAGKAGVLEHDLAGTVHAKVVGPAARGRRRRRRGRQDPGARGGRRAGRGGHQPLDGRRRQGRGPPRHLAGRPPLRPAARLVG